MLLLRRGRGRFPVSYLRIGGIRPHSTGGPLSGFAAKQTELENLRRAVTAARSAVTRSQAKAARLANDEETARVQHLTKRLAAEEGGIEVVKQQLVLDAGLARATAAAIELVDLASTLILPRSVDDSRLLDDEPPLVVPKAPAAPAAVSAAQPWLETVGSAPADVTPADAPRSVAELEAEPVAAEELVGFAMGFWDASHTHRDAAGKMKNQEFKIWEREHPEIVMSAQHSAAGNSRYNSMLSAARAKVEPVAEPAEAQNTEASNDTGVGLGQWLTQFREQKQTEAEQAAEEAAAEEAAHHARQAALAASPPVPVQHFETWRVMPDLYSATKASDVLEVWAVEGEEFVTVIESLRRLKNLERVPGGSGLDRSDPRLAEMLDILHIALAQGGMTSTFRLGRSSTDLSDTRNFLEILGLDDTAAYDVLRAVIDFEGNARVSKETEGRPGEM